MPHQFDDSPYRDDAAPSVTPRHTNRSTQRHTPSARVDEDAGRSPRRRSRRKSRHGATRAAPVHLTSHPTGRAAYVQTREWLLEQHGPVCAYCGRKFEPGSMTLDHVAPRRGQTAYDRRDNLVLACTACNAVKRDLAPAAFLLGNRARAANLLRYGSHLSPMLVDLARSLAPAPEMDEATGAPDSEPLDLFFDDDESPYRD